MTYRIKNWSSYQHIKSRNAPWIKVYRELLDDLEWHNLPSETAKILINCWLIGSENFGNLPDLPNLAFRLRISEVDVKNQLSLLTKWIADEEEAQKGGKFGGHTYFPDVTYKTLKQIAQNNLFKSTDLSEIAPAFDCACTS